MMPARTASQWVQYTGRQSDPIQMRDARELEHPVLINGDPTRTVYALDSLMQMRSHAHGRPIVNPLTRQMVDLRAPGALVAVRWGKTRAEGMRAKATEARMRDLGLRPAAWFSAEYVAPSAPSSIVLCDWLYDLEERWHNRLLRDDTPMAPYVHLPFGMEFQGNARRGRNLAEMALLSLEFQSVSHAALPGTAHIREVVRWGIKRVEAYLNDQVDYFIASGRWGEALEWIAESKLAVKHAVDAMLRWAASNREWAPHIHTGLCMHAERFFQSRVDYWRAQLSHIREDGVRARMHALQTEVIEPFLKSYYATHRMRDNWERALGEAAIYYG